MIMKKRKCLEKKMMKKKGGADYSFIKQIHKLYERIRNKFDGEIFNVKENHAIIFRIKAYQISKIINRKRYILIGKFFLIPLIYLPYCFSIIIIKRKK